jgi:hypothetical protein
MMARLRREWERGLAASETALPSESESDECEDGQARLRREV